MVANGNLPTLFSTSSVLNERLLLFHFPSPSIRSEKSGTQSGPYLFLFPIQLFPLCLRDCFSFFFINTSKPFPFRIAFQSLFISADSAMWNIWKLSFGTRSKVERSPFLLFRVWWANHVQILKHRSFFLRKMLENVSLKNSSASFLVFTQQT